MTILFQTRITKQIWYELKILSLTTFKTITVITNQFKFLFVSQNRKKKAISTDGESDGEYNSGDSKKNTKSDTWMQCNKCKYTTDYHAFLVHHVRQQHKRKTSIAEQDDDSKQANKRFKAESENNVNSQESIHESKLKSLDGDAETVEMIAAEINNFHDTSQSNTGDNDAMVISSVTQGDSSDGTTSIVMTQGEDGQLTALTGTDSNGVSTALFLFPLFSFHNLKSTCNFQCGTVIEIF